MKKKQGRGGTDSGAASPGSMGWGQRGQPDGGQGGGGGGHDPDGVGVGGDKWPRRQIYMCREREIAGRRQRDGE